MCSVARLSHMPVLPDTGCLKSFGELGRECVLDVNAGETYTPYIFLQIRHFHLVAWWWCLLLQSRRCEVIRGCVDARGIDIESCFFPGREVHGRTGLYKAGLGGWAGPPVYDWVVTGSFLSGSPPRCVRGCVRPPLMCQLRFDVPAVFWCVRIIYTLTKSRLC